MILMIMVLIHAVEGFFVRYDMMGRPSGYQALVTKVIEGDLRNKEEIYQLCEGLWTGWFFRFII